LLHEYVFTRNLIIIILEQQLETCMAQQKNSSGGEKETNGNSKDCMSSDVGSEDENESIDELWEMAVEADESIEDDEIDNDILSDQEIKYVNKHDQVTTFINFHVVLILNYIYLIKHPILNYASHLEQAFYYQGSKYSKQTCAVGYLIK
jgi:DNA-binding FrmR family transcriptional regulator